MKPTLGKTTYLDTLFLQIKHVPCTLFDVHLQARSRAKPFGYWGLEGRGGEGREEGGGGREEGQLEGRWRGRERGRNGRVQDSPSSHTLSTGKSYFPKSVVVNQIIDLSVVLTILVSC